MRGPLWRAVSCWRWKPLVGLRMRVTEHRTCAEAYEVPLPCHSSRTGSLPRLAFASLLKRDAFYSFILTVSRLFSSFYLFLILFPLFFYCSVVYCLYGGQFVHHPGHGLIFFVHFSLFAVNARTRSRRRTTGFSFTQRSGLFKIVPVPAKSR